MPDFDITNAVTTLVTIGTTFAVVVAGFAVTRARSLATEIKVTALEGKHEAHVLAMLAKFEALRAEYVSKELFQAHTKNMDERFTQVLNLLNRVAIQTDPTSHH